MFLTALYTKFRSFMHKERCPRRLSFSLAVGVFIAFSPFVGLHTAMVFLFSWLFALNSAILLAVSMFINNPWTMVPIYATDHVVGDGIFAFLGIDGIQLNPSWMTACNTWVTQHTGMGGVSVWAFFIGGNVLSFVMAFIVYSAARYMLMQRRVQT